MLHTLKFEGGFQYMPRCDHTCSCFSRVDFLPPKAMIPHYTLELPAPPNPDVHGFKYIKHCQVVSLQRLISFLSNF